MGFAGVEYMDELTGTICGSVGIGATGQLIDRRDNKVYWVARLGDYNCWMTQNLALDLYGADITKDNSDITTSTWTGAKAVQSGLWSDSATNAIRWYKSPDTSRTGHESYGNYYSWEAATAGTGNSVTTYPGNASGSICPKGWKLPVGNVVTDNGSFGNLITVYDIGNNAAGFAMLRTSPLYFATGGYVNSGRLNNAGTHGYYWSSTANYAAGAYTAYNLSLNSSSVNPTNTNLRYWGCSVRCLVLGS